MASTNDLHVIFGTGPLGLAVMRELVRQGKPVHMVNGRGKAVLPEGVELVASDAYLPDNTRRVTRGAAVVYQCAQPPYHEWAEKFPALQASILEGAAANGAKLVIGDNLYLYGEVDEPIHEGLPYSATTKKGQTRAKMAEAALAAHQSGRLRVTIGRGSDFFGPGVLGSSLGQRVFTPALQGKTASAIGSLDQPHTYTYIDDFGKALVTLGQREEALGRAWHVPNAETLTQRQLISMIFEEIGAPPRMSGMGKAMLRIGGLFIPEARESIEMMYEFEKPFIVDDSQYKRAFGDHATPPGEAIQATIAWYRRHLLAQAG
jgi:nucleoside-diphosphate-sugar epimerase